MRNFVTIGAALLLATMTTVAAQGARPTDSSPARASDWPTWRYDAHRSAATPHVLPAKLSLKWVREFPTPQLAWPAVPRLQFDAAYQPIALHGTLYMGLNGTDKVVALDADTGAEKWTFYAEGPVRFAPVAWRGRLFVVSDDGHLYCLDAATGAELWKFRGGPRDQRLIGNERLISMWPARGAPVVADGKVYFAAGVWPFMGVFLHALDAETGRPLWINDSSGVAYGPQAYNGRQAFGGPAPQGYLVVAGDRLIVPSGRSRPACYDRSTGRLVYYKQGWKYGEWHVSALDHVYFNGGSTYDVATGVYGYRLGGWPYGRLAGRGRPVHSPEMVYTIEKPDSQRPAVIRCFDIRNLKVPPYPSSIRKFDYEYKIADVRGPIEGHVKDLPVEAGSKLWLKAGPRLYAGNGTKVMAIEEADGKVSWTGEVEGRIGGMLAADDKLFVSTREGRLYCFGASGDGTRYALDGLPPGFGPVAGEAAAVLKATGVSAGYCLVLGLDSGELAEGLVRGSGLYVIAVDPDAAKIDAIRRKMDAAGLYGKRFTALVGDPLDFPFPPYVASLIVSEEPEKLAAGGRGLGQRILRALRPYGGVACLALPPTGEPLGSVGSPEGEVKTAGSYTLLVRAGPLPGSADWTHENAGAANTLMSEDSRVRLPLGVLWFGGPSGDNIYYNRHTGPPRAQAVDGRLIARGPGIMHATDIYTGRQLWKVELPEGKTPPWGRVRDSFKPQATTVLGGTYVSVPDGIYARYDWSPMPLKCVRLDPETGEKMKDFVLPDGAPWGYLGIWEDLLVAGASPLSAGQTQLGRDTWNAAASAKLVVMNRHTGKVLWTRDAAWAFRHNAIAIGNGRLFCIDSLPEGVADRFKRRETAAGRPPTLMALDVRTGRVLWRTTEEASGSQLSYSRKHDILVQGMSLAGRRANALMIAHRGSDGKVIWKKGLGESSVLSFILHSDQVIARNRGYDLRTGESRGWSFSTTKTCGAAIAGENIVTFRSANAGFYDMVNYGGVGNWGGFRSGCTSTLIPAGGVLSAPKFDQDCDCNFPIQTSLAFVHMPWLETWTTGGRIMDPKRIGINLGAPGDRVSDEGTFWLGYPSVGRRSPSVPTVTEPDDTEWFRHRSSRMAGDGLPWVAASGGEGIGSVSIELLGDGGPATVRLYFAEPDDGVKAGDRAFDVSLQGRRVLTGFDVAAETGGVRRALVREFTGVKVDGQLKVDLTPSRGRPIISGIEVIRK